MNIEHIQLFRGTATDLASTNPVLLAGELAVETDTGRIKAGNGTSAYNSLEYTDKPHGLASETLTFVLDDEAETDAEAPEFFSSSGSA